MNSLFDTAQPPVLAPSPKKTKGRNIIAVASGKGGVGKTWFSTTLAHSLAKQGKNVLLFDADMGLANVDIQLGLMAKRDLGNVIAGRITLNQAITEYEEGGFDIIAGRSGSGSLANIPLSRLQILNDDLQLLAVAYDYVILDLGAGVEKSVRYFANSSKTCFVVCNDEPTSLTDAYAFIKVTTMDNSKTDIKIVINSVNTNREGERTYNTILKACKGFLKISPPLAGIIRRDTRVRDAIKNQTPILTLHPNSDAATDVKEIADSIMQSP